jgi:alpha-tubulin suppressor-like RCC1 family protein
LGKAWDWRTGSGQRSENRKILSRRSLRQSHFARPYVEYFAQQLRTTNITQISAGWFHILARRADGIAWAWGNNSNGEAGNGTTNNAFSPVQVLNVSNIVAVSGGDSHSSALAADGTIWKWGKNDVGERGNGTTNTSANPFPAKILTDKFGNTFTTLS